MAKIDIEQWEKEIAEIEIRRWLIEHNLWAPELEIERLNRANQGELESTPSIVKTEDADLTEC